MATKQPIISICILTWNRPKFLELCLADLEKKLFFSEKAEIIVMNNGSSPETNAVLDKYKKDLRFKAIQLKKHYGLNAYKKLFGAAKGKYIIDLDDDVLKFPFHFDKKLTEYLESYPDYGFLALNVIQDEHTNGAKPDSSHYKEDVRGNKVIEEGPTGGWCACFRRSDYRKVRLFFNLISLKFGRGEDGAISSLFKKILKLRSGILKDEICFHASGPYYAKQYGHLDREIEKYEKSGLINFVEDYKTHKNK